MEGHRELVIGSNERSWSVDVPFDHFSQKHPTENWPKIESKSTKTHTPSSLGAVGACSCFTNTSLFKFDLRHRPSDIN